jgi:hypothetical protein
VDSFLDNKEMKACPFLYCVKGMDGWKSLQLSTNKLSAPLSAPDLSHLARIFEYPSVLSLEFNLARNVLLCPHFVL